MIVSFFDSYYPSRIIYLALFIAGIMAGCMYFIDVVPLNITNWALLGSYLQQGFMLYGDVWDNTAPLFAVLTLLLETVFAGNHVLYQVAGLIVILGQAILFSHINSVYRLTGKGSYIFSLVYVLFFVSTYFLTYLSPQLCGLVFILFAWKRVLGYATNQSPSPSGMFSLGMWLGLAMLFDITYIYFTIILLLAMVNFSSLTFRFFLNLLLGMFFPIMLASIYFYSVDEFYSFISYYFVFLSKNYNGAILKTEVFLMFAGIVVFWFLIGVLRVVADAKASNFQSKVKVIQLFWTILSVLILLFRYKHLNFFDLAYLAPPFAYFMGSFFLNIRRRFLKEMLFLLCFSSVLAFVIYFNEALFDRPENLNSSVRFLGNSGEQVFVNQNIVNEKLEEPVENLVPLYRTLNIHKPATIQDNSQQHFARFFNLSPLVRKEYRKEGLIYYRKN